VRAERVLGLKLLSMRACDQVVVVWAAQETGVISTADRHSHWGWFVQ
jgi:hypothetical protein